MPQQTQLRAPLQRRSLSACIRVADEAGTVSVVEEEETKEGIDISDNANWNDNDD
jgi:hypothetical protein